MKNSRIFAVAFLVLLGTGITLVQGVVAPNLVTNGGFESGVAGWAPDTSPRKQRERVLRRDDKSRPLVARNRHGWEVHYTRDEHGNVFKKSWVDPEDPRRYVVRLYWFDAEGRLGAETDIHGRKKLYLYGDGNKLIEPMSPEDFIEEKDRLAHLPKRGAQTLCTKEEYDPRNRLRKRADQ